MTAVVWASVLRIHPDAAPALATDSHNFPHLLDRRIAFIQTVPPDESHHDATLTRQTPLKVPGPSAVPALGNYARACSMAPLPTSSRARAARERVIRSWLSRSTACSGSLLVLLRLTLLLQRLLRRLLLTGLLRVFVLSCHGDLLVAELPIMRHARAHRGFSRRVRSRNSTPCPRAIKTASARLDAPLRGRPRRPPPRSDHGLRS